MPRIRFRFALRGTFTRILDRQKRRDHEHLGQAGLVGAGPQDAREARIHGQARHAPAERSDLPRVIDRIEIAQQPIAILDELRIGRIGEGEILDGAEAELRHPQNDAGEIRAQDLRIGESRSTLEVGLVVETNAQTGRNAPAASFALVGARA